MTEPDGPTATLNRWDRTGMIASAACAVHCTLLPLVAAAAPILGLSALLDERVEWTLIGATAIVGLVGHGRAYWRDHRHVVPGLIFAIGLSLVLSGRLLMRSPWLEPISLSVGGALAAASHYTNLRLCRCCTACAEEPGRTIA